MHFSPVLKDTWRQIEINKETNNGVLLVHPSFWLPFTNRSESDWEKKSYETTVNTTAHSRPSFWVGLEKLVQKLVSQHESICCPKAVCVSPGSFIYFHYDIIWTARLYCFSYNVICVWDHPPKICQFMLLTNPKVITNSLKCPAVT